MTATLQSRVMRALSTLMELELWGARRTLDLECFHFGLRNTVRDRNWNEVDVGTFALHVQCPWRIVGPEGMVVGSQDRRYPPDESADWGDFDSDGRSLCEARIEAWLKAHAASPLRVARVDADHVGGFRIFLQEGFVLEAFPADSLRGDYSERWRLFQPSTDEAHFVVAGYGVEE
jgi:hypothetical protein